jgi:ribosome maturation factor RimP
MESKIEALIAPTLISNGFTLVRIKIDQGETCLLQIMAEHLDGGRITLDECTSISRTISAILEVEDPISGEYTLEVSSPGLERPLTKIGDFERYIGEGIKITLNDAIIDNRRRFKGIIKSVSDTNINILSNINGKEEEIEIPYESISAANLLLSEEALKKILSKSN